MQTDSAQLITSLETAFKELPPSHDHAIRSAALAALTRLGFPGSKHEEYRFTPIARQVEKLLTEADDTVGSLAADIQPLMIPGFDANVVVLVNGKFDQSKSTISAGPVKIRSLADSLRDEPAHVLQHLSKFVDPNADAFAAFNTTFWQDGVFIEVPPNTTVDKPILLIHVHESDERPVASVSRLLLVIGAGSRVQLTERFDTIGKAPAFSSWVEEIVVGEKSSLEYCKIQNDPGELYQVATSMIHQHTGSRVDTYTLTSNGKMIRNNFGIAIDGERCESHFFGLYLLQGDTLADNHTVVDHRQPNSFSNELYKGILDGQSRGIFNGKIYVRPHAQKTNAFQANRNVLLNDTAVVHTKPQLEIWADDVKCSHGCTSGQLDEEAVFYLQSRGISKKQAQAMLLFAFANEVFETLANEPLKNYLNGIVSERLHTAD